MTAQASIPGEREHPSLALVNTRHNSRTGMVDHLARPEHLREWLAWRSLLPRGGASGDSGAAPSHGPARGAADSPAPPHGGARGDSGAAPSPHGGARGDSGAAPSPHGPGDSAAPPHGGASAERGAGPSHGGPATGAAERAASPRESVAIEQADLDAALALRDAVRELLVAAVERRPPARSALEVVNDAAALAPAADQLRWGRGGPIRARSSPAATELQRALAALAEDAIALVCDHRDDLIACEAPGCVRLLLKDHPRRHWCSTRCGDRVRAARYYRRSRESAS